MTEVLAFKNYINGEWVDSKNTDLNQVFNQGTQEVIATTPSATQEEVERAIAIAKEVFESGKWSELTVHERADYLNKIADKIDERANELIDLEVMNNGKIRAEAEFDIGDSADCFRYYASLVRTQVGETFNAPASMQSMIVREPVGVAGLIVPWNLPLVMAVWKIAPALAAGNTLVIKPAELTPITLVKLFEIIDEVELPKGVANLVMGKGSVVGQILAESHDIDIVSFTGSTDVGKQIMIAAAGNLKKVSLELGGKSPNIIFADADFETAVDHALFGIFFGAGQVCSAGSRILVEASIYDKFVNRMVERASQIKVGPGNDPTSEMGAITSQKQLDTILKYIEIGQAEGATLALGGKRLIERGLDRGYFIEPTIFTDVTSSMRIVREEIFGPVVVIQKFENEEEAIKLANDTVYGLAGAVFTKDGTKAIRVIKKVRAGITWVNTYHPTFNEAPWGGYKQSGIGRSLGSYGLDDFQEVKQININLDVEPLGWFKN